MSVVVLMMLTSIVEEDVGMFSAGAGSGSMCSVEEAIISFFGS